MRTGGCTTSTWQQPQRRDLTPFDGVQTQIVAMERGFPTEVLIGMNKDNPASCTMCTGGLTWRRVGTDQGRGQPRLPGLDGRLQARRPRRVRATNGAIELAMVRDSAEHELLFAEDALTTDPVTFSADGRSLLMVSSVGAETARLVRIDLSSRCLGGARS